MQRRLLEFSTGRTPAERRPSADQSPAIRRPARRIPIEHWATTPIFLTITPSNLAFASLVAFAAWLAIRGALMVARKALDRVADLGSSKSASALSQILRGTHPMLVVLTALLIGISTLVLPAAWHERVSHLWFVTLIVQVALWCNRGIAIALDQYFRRIGGDSANLAQASATSTLLSWALHTGLWTVVMLAILSNLGVNISAFIASLGVGGIAIALAAQNILGDLFASLSIAIDKPFEVGDAISVGDVTGTVERVGLKTTRIRSFVGEQVVISNTNLLTQTVRNYKRLHTRRIVYPIGITYDATPDQVEAVPQIMKRLIEADPRLRFDRSHLKGFGESSIDFETVFHVQAPEYGVFMECQQALGLALMREFAERGISFAFPSRTVYLVNPPASADARASGGPAGSPPHPAPASPMSPAPGGPAP